MKRADSLDPHIGCPVSLSAAGHRDFRQIYVLTYLAVRKFASLAPAAKDYCRCFPSIESIRRHFGIGRASVFRALEWLEAQGYIYHQRRSQEVSLYTLVVRRAWFVEIRDTQGLESAKKAYEAWLVQAQDEARGRIARAAAPPSPSASRGTRARNTSSPRGNSERTIAPAPSGSEVSAASLQGVSPGRHHSTETQIKIQQLGRPISKRHLRSGEDPPEFSRSHKESEGQLPPSLRASVAEAVKKVPPAGMTEAQRQARWQELQRQRALLIAEAEQAPK